MMSLAGSDPADLDSSPEGATTPRPRFRNWLPTIAVLTLVTVGLASALLMMLGTERADPARPLMVKLILLCLLFTSYLIHQETRSRNVHQKWETALEGSLEALWGRQIQMAGVLKAVQAEGDLRFQEIFDSITEVCRNMFPCDRASLMLLDPSSQLLEVRSVTGHPCPDQLLGRCEKVGHGMAGKVALSRTPAILGPRSRPKSHRECPTFSAMIVPVMFEGTLVGVLCVSSSGRGVVYTQDDLLVLKTFAKAAGVHCWQAEQNKHLNQTLDTLKATLGSGVA